MLTTLAQAEEMAACAALTAPPEGPEERGWHKYLGELSAYALLDRRALREVWGYLTGVDEDPGFGYPCQGCGSECDLHQPGCEECDPAYLAYLRYQLTLCHAPTSNYGPQEDPYGSSCDKLATHVGAMLPDGSGPDMEARKHSGPDALGGGRVEWFGGGRCPGSGDDIGMRDFRMIPEEMS